MASKTVNLAMVSDDQQNAKRIRLRIPKDYQQEPVISRLVSNYGLTVNITAAILGANGIGDGWFDLDLQGTSAQIESALTYINDLDLEIWHDVDTGSW
jgi:ABC-type methionine transport system ATPase subunit